MTRVSPDRVLGLDALRAAAILMVLFSHWLSHFNSWLGIGVPPVVDAIGDAGVEIFFALSGFLIGRILIGVVSNRPSWRDFGVFMARRGIRTLPLYFVWLGLLLWVFPPRQDVAATALRFLTLTQNLISEMPADYYFVVTWSLTIEEWFYLLFGFILTFLARHTTWRRALGWTLAMFLLPPLALRLGYAYRGPLVFYRIDEIGYGVLMAWWSLTGGRLFRHPSLALLAGLGLLGLAVAGWLPLPPALAVPLTSNAQVIGGALCLPMALRVTRAAAWLQAVVRWLAGRSYALYLMHLTLLVDVVERQIFEPGLAPVWACIGAAVLLPFLLAELSYRCLETPVLRWRPAQRRSSPPAIIAPGRVVAV